MGIKAHIFFLTLNNIGPVTVEKIIEVNPDIDQWDRLCCKPIS